MKDFRFTIGWLALAVLMGILVSVYGCGTDPAVPLRTCIKQILNPEAKLATKEEPGTLCSDGFWFPDRQLRTVAVTAIPEIAICRKLTEHLYFRNLSNRTDRRWQFSVDAQCEIPACDTAMCNDWQRLFAVGGEGSAMTVTELSVQ